VDKVINKQLRDQLLEKQHLSASEQTMMLKEQQWQQDKMEVWWMMINSSWRLH
jgi:hypothetical protein